jgi:hypothetical protein
MTSFSTVALRTAFGFALITAVPVAFASPLWVPPLPPTSGVVAASASPLTVPQSPLDLAIK